MKGKGNVVVGFTRDAYLMLDCDQRLESDVVKFADDYATFHKHLGSALVMKSSEDGQVDLLREKLGHFFIIFGAVLNWDVILWHIWDACKLGITNKAFAVVCTYLGSRITLRLNAKNDKIPHPTIVHYFRNGEFTGIGDFLKEWVAFKNLG